MSKLLNGQSLYISKHLRNQSRSLIDDSPFVEPSIPDSTACIITTSNACYPIDLIKLLLRTSPQSQTFIKAQKLDQSSYLFADIPQKLNNLQLFDDINYLGRIEPKVFTTLNDLASFHFYKWYFPQLIDFRSTFIDNPIWASYSVRPGARDVTIDHDEATLSATLPFVGSFTAKVMWLPTLDLPGIFVIRHTHSTNTKFRWKLNYLFSLDWDLICHVNPQGLHVIDFCEPWINVADL